MVKRKKEEEGGSANQKRAEYLLFIFSFSLYGTPPVSVCRPQADVTSNVIGSSLDPKWRLQPGIEAAANSQSCKATCASMTLVFSTRTDSSIHWLKYNNLGLLLMYFSFLFSTR